jgi:hypothetical protein
VAAPEDEAGGRLVGLLRRAAPEAEAHVAASADDVVIYRERTSLPLAALPQLGPEGHDAYIQMSSANCTPHSRMDVRFVMG